MNIKGEGVADAKRVNKRWGGCHRLFSFTLSIYGPMNGKDVW
jgi:hypothetical protein